MTLRAFLGLGAIWLAVQGAIGAGWGKTPEGFLWQQGDELVLARPNGTLRIGLRDGPGADVAFFQWHDAWIYERLDAGKVEQALRLLPDGTLAMSGAWGTTKDAPPLRYAMTLTPGPDGVDLALTVRKTAALKLTSGIWCNIGIDRSDDGRRIYARPVAGATLGKNVGGTCDALLAEVRGRRSIVLQGDGYRSLRSRVGKNHHGIEMNLHRGRFEVGKEAVVNLHLGFADMPETFPGRIDPSRKALRLAEVAAPKRAELYGLVELMVDLQGTWDNPFDPDDVALDAVVTLPSGKTYTQPGFYMVEQARRIDGRAEVMVPTPSQGWRVRLAATEIGALRCELRARDRSGKVNSVLAPIQVLAGKRKGFVRQSKQDPRYLAFDDGSGYFPIGHNLPIYPTNGQLVDEALGKMAKAGENWNRWWMSAAGLGLEWEPKLGRYRQNAAARLDYAIGLAEQHGFYYMMCMDTHQDFRASGWQANPFNVANGGPCKTPREWFTDATARTLYRKRLRYTVARWGYSPHVLCWEFGNEFEGWANTDNAVKLPWHREMSDYLADLDPYRHLITTSWWSKTGPEAFWRLPNIDIVQTHCYTNNDVNVAEQLLGYCRHQWQTFEKPHIFAEFGIRSHSSTADKDPKGWGLHNGSWACVAGGANGPAMPWWHRNYIDPLDLYFHFTAIRNFTQDLPFGTARWRVLETSKPEYIGEPVREVRDLVLTPTSGFRKRPVTEFRVQPDGSVNDSKALLDLLHGEGHKDLQAFPTFIVNYPKPGTFVVQIERVSNSGHLKIFVDDALALAKEYPCGEGHGKSTVFREKWNLWENVYDEPATVRVPAGEHRVRVENHGKDWVRVSRVVFENCQVVQNPNLLAAALACDDAAIVWIQNRDSSWYNHGRDKVPTVPPATLAVRGLRDGVYDVQWWETWKGMVTKTEPMTVKGGVLDLRLPAIRTDLALKLRPKRGG
ncbi:MAG: DUF5060 domain-containing protein [Victivallales bacterium]|nr:DUF5060 domain-containing protein [Victivallales bacterium]